MHKLITSHRVFVCVCVRVCVCVCVCVCACELELLKFVHTHSHILEENSLTLKSKVMVSIEMTAFLAKFCSVPVRNA